MCMVSHHAVLNSDEEKTELHKTPAVFTTWSSQIMFKLKQNCRYSRSQYSYMH